MSFIFVGLGGFVGCICRYGLTLAFTNLNLNFPISTLVSNVIAGFLIGLFSEFESSMGILSKKSSLFLKTGLIGGLSTFSAFSLETLNLMSKSHYLLTLSNIFLNVFLSFLGVFLGSLIGKFILGKISIS